MQPYLVAAVFLIGMIATVNLILTYGAIRRLREHNERLTTLATAGFEPPPLMLDAGAMPREFAAVAVDNEPVTQDSMAGGGLVGFFSPDCAPCKEQLPLFAKRAAEYGRPQVLAVAVGSPDATRAMVEQLVPVANVVVETAGGPLQLAFAVNGFPAMCVLDGDGRIAASASALDQLPELSRA
jgi:hypothetical protein